MVLNHCLAGRHTYASLPKKTVVLPVAESRMSGDGSPGVFAAAGLRERDCFLPQHAGRAEGVLASSTALQRACTACTPGVPVGATETDEVCPHYRQKYTQNTWRAGRSDANAPSSPPTNVMGLSSTPGVPVGVTETDEVFPHYSQRATQNTWRAGRSYANGPSAPPTNVMGLSSTRGVPVGVTETNEVFPHYRQRATQNTRRAGRSDGNGRSVPSLPPEGDPEHPACRS